MAAPPDLERGVAPLGPLCPRSHCSLDLGLLLSAAAPDLGHGVAPLGRAEHAGRRSHLRWVAGRHSRLSSPSSPYFKGEGSRLGLTCGQRA